SPSTSRPTAPSTRAGAVRSAPTSGGSKTGGSSSASSASRTANPRGSPRGADAEATARVLRSAWRGHPKLPFGPRPADSAGRALRAGSPAAGERPAFVARRLARHQYQARSGRPAPALARRQGGVADPDSRRAHG